jgi:glycosyltransferase involved in cell wall biosynthesis
MSAANAASGSPLVSVIVPARNEEVSLGACLESLVIQTGVSFEIIVVDDGSTDRTREIAQSFAGVKVIEPGPLPEGWSGKNNAMLAGAKHARGQWLLFTDADTVHLPGSLARSVDEAKKQGASLLSYSPEQEVYGFWERAVMPVIFADLAATYRPSEVSNPNSAAAAANGQYLLVSREAYDAVGGHSAVAKTLLEDVAFARAVKMSGRKIFFRFAGDAVRTRMYRSFALLREGWTKNLALLFPSPIRLAALRLIEFLLIVGSAGATVFEVFRSGFQIGFALACLFLAIFTIFVVRIQKAHFSPQANRVAAFGLPIFAYLLLRSKLSYKHGKVGWKGRTYRGAAEGAKTNHAGTAASAVPPSAARRFTRI